MSAEKELSADRLKPKAIFGIRHVQTLMLFIAMVLAYGMRVNVSMAIVAMTDKDNDNWTASPVSDMFADAVAGAALAASAAPAPRHLPLAPKLDRMHFKECVIEMLQEMFGEDSVPKMFKGEKLYVTVDNKRADIDLLNMEVICREDEGLERCVQSAITKLYAALAPVKPPPPLA